MTAARDFMIPLWSEDLGHMLEARVAVEEICSRCQRKRFLDLAAMAAKLGPRYSLWNRRPPCPTPGCGDRLWFRAQPPNAWHKIMCDVPPAMVEGLHARWRATLPKAQRDSLPLSPMLEATDSLVEVGCELCGHRFYLNRMMVDAWGPGLSTDDLAARFRLQCGRTPCVLELEMTPRCDVPYDERPEHLV
ncbi:MAG: hypothetical protein KBC34_00815 [Phenylobacterium sp.]|nr:hypothetical protein [Phenylobacterium sp.]